MDRWTRSTQDATLITADSHGERYTQDEIDFVAAFADEAIAELATSLGRTYFAISTLRGMIKEGRKIAAPRVAASDRPYRGFKIGDDEGWD